MTARGFELARQRRDLRLETRRHFTGFRIAPGGLGQTLVRQRQRQVVRHPPPEVHIVIEKCVGLTRRKNSEPKTWLPSGSVTRSADLTPK